MTEPEPVALTGPVQIIGTGMLGTSVGLALVRAGLEVWLSDANPKHVRTAAGLGAGVPTPESGTPQLVVVAVPPGALAEVITRALASGAAVTDVGSVKAGPLADIAAHADTARYVGGHPMAGSERSGPLAASSALFDGRPWAVTPHPEADPGVVRLVRELARTCGAVVVEMTPQAHDAAVARTSHLPHLMSVLVAGRLADADPDQLALSGQGVRDVTRVAGGDPRLWQQIVRLNAPALRALLGEVRDDLDRVLAALEPAPGAAEQDHADAALAQVLEAGVRGTRAIPGKHGRPAFETASVHVAVPDQAGALAALLADVGSIGANLEDLHIDHDPGRPYGLVEVVVAAEAAEPLRVALESRNWQVHR